jgi:tetratricopeptide (TPR) repeat protein
LLLLHKTSSAPKDFSVKAVLLAQVTEGYINLQDQAKAQEVLSQALEAAKSIKEAYSKSNALSAIAGAYGKLNDANKAQEVLSQAIEPAKSIKYEPFKVNTLITIAQAYLKLNDVEKAKASLSDAAKSAEIARFPTSTSKVAQVYAELGNWGEALRLSHRCYIDEKVAVLARILRVHAEQENPEFKALREEKPDKDGE